MRSTRPPGPIRNLALASALVLLAAACLGSAAAKPEPTAAPAIPQPTPAPQALATAAVLAPSPVLPTPASWPVELSTPPPPTAAAPTLPPATPPTTAPPATAAPTAPPPSQAPAFGSMPLGSIQEARVVRVVDGDTIRVEMGGQEFRVRYIGIDTPETVHPTQPVEWMGREASAANKALVEGRTVILERDVSETDQYGRLLRYVWVADGAGWLLVNRELVRLGFAQAFTYPPDVMYADLFVEAQQRARDAARGLWGDPPPEEPPQEPPGDGNDGKDGQNESCDPSYPGVCIPPAPPDLDCGDIPERDFKVRGADPHRFDGDNDGLGCESGGGNGGGGGGNGGGGDGGGGGGGGSCHPSYPGVCIPPAPPDLDCGDVPFRDFRVRGADPHGFDGDGDGFGCES